MSCDSLCESCRVLAEQRRVLVKTVRLVFLALSTMACVQSSPTSPAATDALSPKQRLKISEATSSQLVVQRVTPKYPEASRNAGVQGAVVLQVELDATGSVQNVTVVSGEPKLAQAAVDAVQQWKYKPYLVEGKPVEIETQVTVNFRLARPVPPDPPDLGSFNNDSYRNQQFHLFYPLSHDWVRETEIMRKRSGDDSSRGIYILLTEVHIPQDNRELRADTSFTLVAVRRSADTATGNCEAYLAALGSSIQASRRGKQRGGVSQFAAGGLNFLRADFEYTQGSPDHSVTCAAEGEYLLLWNIEGSTNKAVEVAIATLDSLGPIPPPVKSQPVQTIGSSLFAEGAHLAATQIGMGASSGLLIKKVQPIYPQEAKYAGIQGSVVMQAEISKNGDVADLEIVDGPLELAVSAVNAVRQWRYRPYTVNGEPVAVNTQIIVNYSLR